MAPLRSRDGHARQPSEGMSHSWIEIGSQPSSSSRSSATDEIITTGLTVQHDSNLHARNRRLRALAHLQMGVGPTRPHAGGSSSQEEFEESESESDRVMSSETMSEREDEEEEEDGDENATAVNYPRSTPRSVPQEFQPRPNAFSHSNHQQQHQQHQQQQHQQQQQQQHQPTRPQPGTAYIPPRNPRPSSQRQQSYPQHTPYNLLAPSYQPDHDEALRASLSTLLSAAAAVRGLPKPGQPRSVPPPSTRVEPTSLHMVPESVALGSVSSKEPSSPRAAAGPSKRKTSPPASFAPRSSSKDRRAGKKARNTSTSPVVVQEVSPTLLTWVVSAGVVVLVSALGFSVGYVIGKEAGHAEAVAMQLHAAGGEAGRCGKEVTDGLQGTGLGLRKLRWSSSTGVPV